MDRPFTRIACCIDRDDMAERVLHEGIRLVGEGAAGSVQVVHVVAPPQAVLAGPFAYVAPTVEMSSEAQAWIDETTRDMPEATTVLLYGNPARELCSWARTWGPDLIIASAHRGLIEKAMLGGFASYIAYHAPCPVLLIHRPAEGEGETAAPTRAAAERPHAPVPR